MKQHLNLLVIALLAIVSCEKPQLEPEQDQVVGKITLESDAAIVLSDEGSSEQVEFTATLDWKAVSDQEWLTVMPKAGMAGDASVTMSAEKNTLEESRNAIVTLSCGKDTKTIEVTQKQAGALLLTQSSIEVAAEGGTVTITAKSNSNATASVDASAMTWITEVKTRALVEYIFNFEIAANESEMPRNGRIIFSNADGKREVVTIEQAGVVVEPEVTYNIFGQVTCNGEGVADVLVSDGYEIVKTDAEGKYTLQSNKECGYVFITNPAGYDFPVEGVLPSNYKLLSQNYVETVEEVNFVLEQAPSDNYTLLVFGDIHLANRTNDVEQFTKVAADINNRVDATPGKVYALTLGDMTWEMYWLDNNYGFAEYKNTINSTLRNLTLFHTMGNHDNEMEVGEDWAKSLKYTQNLAPDYYSFNIGKCHYIVLDNMDYEGIAAGHDNRSKYARNYTASQLAWLRKDLEHVDKSTPVFVTSHEPLSSPDGTGWDGELNGKDADLNKFISIFEGYDVRFLSGHTHNIYHRTYNQNFKEHNSGAVCASWWWTGYMTPGIHVAQDGTPGGYTVWTINGTERKHYYQAALQSADYQLRAYDMNKVKEVIDADATGHKDYQNKYLPHIQNYEENTILVNVWDFDEDWTISISENGTPLKVEEVGDRYDPLHLVAMTIPRMNWSSPTTTFSTCKWCHFFEAKASSADSPVTVTVTDRNGKVYTEEMIRPKAFVVDDYKNDVVRIKPQAAFKESSSSSLVFGWTTGGTAAEDAELPYKLSLYKDAACTELVQSFDIPANLDKWEGKSLRFAFGGLEPSTTYYFVVTNQQNGDISDVVSGTTKAFTVVDPSTVANATAGTVLLAEDFSFIGWGNDQFAKAIGFIPNGDEVGTISGHKTTDDGYYQAAETVLTRLFSDRPITSDHRLHDWGYYGKGDVYILNGAIRAGQKASGRRTHIVTPALTGIPAGKTATVDVTVTSSIYDSSNEVGVFVEDYTALTKEGRGQFTGASLSNGYSQDADVKKWSTKTVRISGVDCNSCLLIGSLNDVDTKNRFFIDDVVVTLVEFETPQEPEEPEQPVIEGLVAECVTTSSSTLIFKWQSEFETSELVSHAFTATLYKDAACTVVDQSFDFPAGCAAWNNKTPKYVFGGLQPATDYWFKVFDTTANLESEPIKCTTDAFTPVQMPASITETGVVLAEDFGEIRWGFDHLTGAVGFHPESRSSWTNTQVESYTNSSDDDIDYSACGDAIKGSRLNGWVTDTYVYVHPGYLELGSYADGGWILTPEFTVPEGKKAIVRASVTFALLNTSQCKDWCFAVLNPDRANVTEDDHTASFSWPDTKDSALYQKLNFEKTDWETKTVSDLEICAGDRIAFGIDKNGNKKLGPAFVSDIVYEVLEIVEE